MAAGSEGLIDFPGALAFVVGAYSCGLVALNGIAAASICVACILLIAGSALPADESPSSRAGPLTVERDVLWAEEAFLLGGVVPLFRSEAVDFGLRVAMCKFLGERRRSCMKGRSTFIKVGSNLAHAKESATPDGCSHFEQFIFDARKIGEGYGLNVHGVTILCSTITATEMFVVLTFPRIRVV